MLQGENRAHKAAIEDLEMKNRLLVDKLNAQIYQQAAIYKEKTMHALSKVRSDGSHSPAPQNRDLLNSRGHQLSNNVYGLGNESAFARSPLGNRGSI